MTNMQKMSQSFTDFMRKYFPDSFVFAIILFVIVVVSGLLFTPTTPLEMLDMFGAGIWGLLAFTMQLIFVLVAASAIANFPPIKRFLARGAAIPKTPAQGVVAVVLVAAAVGLLNWGAGLVVGAFFAKEIAKQVKGSHYPLLIAAAYVGYQMWGSGISSSIPLTVNTPGHALEKVVGMIRFDQTIFSGYNLVITAVQLVAMVLILRAMTPDPKNAIAISQEVAESDDFPEEPELPKEEQTFAYKIENNRIVSLIAGVSCLAYFALSFYRGGVNSLNLNSINLLSFGIGLCLYKGLAPYMRVVTGSAKAIVPVIMLYPFYSAISTIITASGLGAMVTMWFASFSTKATLGLITYISAGIINIFIPAAGGQWIVQAPIFIPLAEMFDVNKGLVTMAISYGDTWTNLLQPFWALPMLAIARVKVQDMIGYSILACIVNGIVTSICFIVLPLLFGF
jgi:short-chain fatty acids transporter